MKKPCNAYGCSTNISLLTKRTYPKCCIHSALTLRRILCHFYSISLESQKCSIGQKIPKRSSLIKVGRFSTKETGLLEVRFAPDK
jgi:hypothetical protein